MKSNSVIRIGHAQPGFTTPMKFYIDKNFRYSTYNYGFTQRIFLALIDYVLIHSKKFDYAEIWHTEFPFKFPNGTWSGLHAFINRSEIDVGFPIFSMSEDPSVDYIYPINIASNTFMTGKPENKPQTWGIFRTISLPVWIAIMSTISIMTLVYYIYFRRKYSLDKILLHTWAVFLRQNSIVNPSKIAEKFLIFSWIFGSMFLCLAYDSVFLSFLSFPPVNKIKDIAGLAKGVENDEIQCLCGIESAVLEYMFTSNEKKFKVIAANILTNGLNNRHHNKFRYFFENSKKQNLALILDTDFVDALKADYFISPDYYFDMFGSFLVGKKFCCKNLLEAFTHRVMASGLFSKWLNDDYFRKLLKFLLSNEKEENSHRKLTLKDLAPAFIFLITGHFISVLVFIWEFLSKKRHNLKLLKKNKIRKICNETSV